MQEFTTATTPADRIEDLCNRIDTLQNIVRDLEATRAKDRDTIAGFRNRLHVDTRGDLQELIKDVLDDKEVTDVAVRSSDMVIHIFIEGLTLNDDGEIVAPVRDWLVEGVLTVPVSFRVSAASHDEAREEADDIMNELSHDVEVFVDDFAPDSPNVTEIRSGMPLIEVDRVDEE